MTEFDMKEAGRRIGISSCPDWALTATECAIRDSKAIRKFALRQEGELLKIYKDAFRKKPKGRKGC